VTPVGALEASALGAAMRDSAGLYPLAEIVHTLGIALLFMAAGANAALFQVITFRTADVWDAEAMRPLGPPPSARIAGAAWLVLWMSVIACGRLLAYF